MHMAINDAAWEWVYRVQDIVREFLGSTGNFVSSLHTKLTNRKTFSKNLGFSSPGSITDKNYGKFGDRAFSVAGPTVWNSLPKSVRSAETLASFKCKLKTYLFNISF